MPHRAPFDFEHTACGAAVHAKVVSDAGHDVAPHEVVMRRARRR